MLKQYPLDQSPLYRIVGLKQLEARLNIKIDRIDKLLHEGSYRTWVNEKGRSIQHPVGWLKSVHKTLATYLSRIETPNYVYHKKGRSHLANANEHKGYQYVSKTDISHYYPSTIRAMVKAMFISQFKCAKDVAGILADICTYQQSQIPTGSSISGYLAFFANKMMFDEVYELCKSKECTFTLYVDDLTISGDAATPKMINQIRKIIVKYGLKTKDKKTITYNPFSAKLITGVVVKGNQCLLRNIHHKKINDTKKAIAGAISPIVECSS